MEATSRIRQLNDEFRSTLLDSKLGSQGVYFTAAIARLPLHEQSQIIRRVVEYDEFTAENDPHGEHDFGSFEFAGERILWKIDCYDLDLHYGSPDPSDPAVTKRILTIMFGDDY